MLKQLTLKKYHGFNTKEINHQKPRCLLQRGFVINLFLQTQLAYVHERDKDQKLP